MFFKIVASDDIFGKFFHLWFSRTFINYNFKSLCVTYHIVLDIQLRTEGEGEDGEDEHRAARRAEGGEGSHRLGVEVLYRLRPEAAEDAAGSFRSNIFVIVFIIYRALSLSVATSLSVLIPASCCSRHMQ